MTPMCLVHSHGVWPSGLTVLLIMLNCDNRRSPAASGEGVGEILNIELLQGGIATLNRKEPSGSPANMHSTTATVRRSTMPPGI